MLCHHLLVGGNHGLTALQGLPQVVEGGLFTAHDLHHYVYFRVLENVLGVGGEDVRGCAGGARLFQVSNQDAADSNRDPGLLGNQGALTSQGFHDTAAHNSQTQKAHVDDPILGIHYDLYELPASRFCLVCASRTCLISQSYCQSHSPPAEPPPKHSSILWLPRSWNIHC